MFIKKKNMLFIVSFLFFVPLVGMGKTKKSVEQDSLKLQTPPNFWKQDKVVKMSLGVGVAGLVLSGPITAVASGVLCYELIDHKSRKGAVGNAKAHIVSCNAKMLDIAQLAKKDKAQFMKAIKDEYGLPNGLVKVHEQLVADVKRLKLASQLLEQSYTVNPDNALPDQLAKLKGKKMAVDFQLQDAMHAIEVLSTIPAKL